MRRDQRRRRGEPLAALVVVLSLWVGGRIGLGGSVFLPERLEALEAGDPRTEPKMSAIARPQTMATTLAARWPMWPVAIVPEQANPDVRATVSALRETAIVRSEESFAGPASDGEQAAMAPPPFRPALDETSAAMSRWSVDAWVLVRRSDGAGFGVGLPPATYGASQTGAVLRYRIAQASPHRPTVYLRASRALDGPSQSEAAIGFSARPIADIPIVAAGEARVFRDAFGTRLRPTALAISEFPPVDLGQGLRAEAYVQAGYAGGKDATAFADGQVRLDHSAWRAGRIDLRLGAGAWGGAQKGASRLDAGPSLSATAPLGDKVFARASLDWRFRVAGEAAPRSGPALTVSAGF